MERHLKFPMHPLQAKPSLPSRSSSRSLSRDCSSSHRQPTYLRRSSRQLPVKSYVLVEMMPPSPVVLAGGKIDKKPPPSLTVTPAIHTEPHPPFPEVCTAHAGPMLDPRNVSVRVSSSATHASVTLMAPAAKLALAPLPTVDADPKVPQYRIVVPPDVS
jgi:hypothetical protein